MSEPLREYCDFVVKNISFNNHMFISYPDLFIKNLIKDVISINLFLLVSTSKPHYLLLFNIPIPEVHVLLKPLCLINIFYYN